MSLQIHKHMTKRDLLSVFYVDSHNKGNRTASFSRNCRPTKLDFLSHPVPEYELSSVRLFTKRSVNDDEATKHVHLKAFGRNLRLKLKDNNDFNERVKDMKVIIAETSKNGQLQYMEDPSAAVSGDLVAHECRNYTQSH